MFHGEFFSLNNHIVTAEPNQGFHCKLLYARKDVITVYEVKEEWISVKTLELERSVSSVYFQTMVSSCLKHEFSIRLLFDFSFGQLETKAVSLPSVDGTSQCNFTPGIHELITRIFKPIFPLEVSIMPCYTFIP